MSNARPRGLPTVTLVLAVLNGFGLLLFGSSGWEVLTVVGTTCVMVWVYLWFFWLGRDWARWLVILACVVVALPSAVLHGLLGSPVIGSRVPATRLLFVVEGAFALFLLYYLKTRRVREYYKQQTVQKSG